MNEYAAGKPWKMAKAQHILEAGYKLFSERGIEAVAMPEVAQASGVSRATLFRYFATKLELVVAIGAWKWSGYIAWHNGLLSPEDLERMSGADRMRFYLDSFLDMYRNRGDLLRFNYNFNGYLGHEVGTAEQRQPYMTMLGALGSKFHEIYELGMRDGTLRTDISEASMFSSSFHIMLAAATRYAVGLVYMSDEADPEAELVMLEELLLSRYVCEPNVLPDSNASA